VARFGGVEFGVRIPDRLVEKRFVLEDAFELVEEGVFEVVGAEGLARGQAFPR
jgi:hypothetical protein